MATRGAYFLVGVLLGVAAHVNGKCVFTATSTTTKASKSSFSLKNIFRGGPLSSQDCPQESSTSTSCGIGDLACYAQQISGLASGAACSSQAQATPAVIDFCKSETEYFRMVINRKPYKVNVASAARDSTGVGARASSSKSSSDALSADSGESSFWAQDTIFHTKEILDKLAKNASISSLGTEPLTGKNQRRPPPRPRTPSASRLKRPSSNSSTDRPSLSATFQSFSGLNFYEARYVANRGNQLSVEPPEPSVCVGNGFVLQTVQRVLRVFNATNVGEALIPPLDLYTFHGLPAEYDRSTPWGIDGPYSLGQPNCFFDADSNRWFHTVVSKEFQNGNWLSGKSSILLAVSTSSDPTQDWMIYSIPTQNDGTDGTPDHSCYFFDQAAWQYAHGPCFPDDVRLNVNKHGVYITTNDRICRKEPDSVWLIEDFAQANIYALPKDHVVKGLEQASLYIMVADNNYGISLAPAIVVPGTVDPPQPQSGSASRKQNSKRTDPLGFGDFSNLFSQDIGKRASAASTAGKGRRTSAGNGLGAVGDLGSSVKFGNTGSSNSAEASKVPSTSSVEEPVIFLSSTEPTGTTDTLYVWKLFNTSSLSTSNPSLELQMYPLFLEEAYSAPVSAEQPTSGSSALPIGECLGREDCLGWHAYGPQRIAMAEADTKIRNVVQMGSKLWGVWSTGVEKNGKSLSGAYWVEVDAGGLPVVTKQGIVAVERNSILAPSIAMKAANKGAISFTVSGEDYYPTSAFVTFDGSATGELVVVKNGTAYLDSYNCYDPTKNVDPNYQRFSPDCLWSKASSSQTDSVGNIWTATEMIETDGTTCTLDHWKATGGTCDKTRGLYGNWATRISKISFA